MATRPAQQTDAYGDPLPPGMRLRIGSARLTCDTIRLVASDDGALLAGGDAEGWVSVWDTRTGVRLHRMRSKSVKGKRHVWRVEHLCFSPEAFLLASSCGGFVTCWDLGTGKPRWEERLEFDFSLPLAFSPDGTKLAAGHMRIHVFDVGTGARIATLPDQGSQVEALAFCDDGARLVAGHGRHLTVLAVDGTGASRSLVLPDPTGEAVSMMSNRLVLPATCDRITNVGHCADGVYEVDLDAMHVRRHQPWPEHRVAPSPADIALGPATAVVIDGAAHRQDPSGAWVPLGGPTTSGCALSRDGAVLALVRLDGGQWIELYDGDSPMPRHAIARVTGPVAFGRHDGRSALIAPCPGQLVAFDPGSGATLGTRAFPPGRLLDLQLEAGRAVLREPGDHDSVRDLDGELLAAESTDARPRLVSPDGQSWISKRVKYRDEALFLCRLDGTKVEIWRGHGPSYSLAFSDDGGRLAAGFYSEAGRIWDTRTLQCTGTIPLTYIWCMSWSSGGARLLCGAYGGKAGVWDPVRNDWEVQVDCGRRMVHSVAWAPDADRFATSSQTIQIWSRNGALQHTVRSSGALRFTPDGGGLTVRHDTLIEIWEIG